MNKAQLVASISEKSGITKKDSEKFLNAYVESVEEALEKGEKVQLVGFGTFAALKRAARVGRNPRTNEEIHIPESTVPKFVPGKEFKGKVNVVKKSPKKKACKSSRK